MFFVSSCIYCICNYFMARLEYSCSFPNTCKTFGCFKRKYFSPSFFMVCHLTRRWSTKAVKLSIAVMFSTLFIGEYLVFLLTAFVWNVPVKTFQDDLTVLILSDPQIQGYKFESQGIVGHITRWDACRYLKKTFSQAMNAVKPDAVILLGDLFDEGYIASDEIFLLYKEWFKDIYQIPESVKRIYLAGDNDVGGEAEPLDSNLLKRHEKYFGNTNEIIKFKNWQFLKLNTLSFLRSYQYTSPDEKRIFDKMKMFASTSTRKLDTTKHTVILSHLPVSHWDSHFAVKVLRETSPRVIFSGHVHKESYRTYRLSGFLIQEHILPTCSYRMGTVTMGIGVAVFGKDGSFQYSVLNLPARYSFLFLYLVVLVLCVLYVLVCGSRTK